jgi:glycine cleavage system pyridoxal-binding protein P
MGKIINFPIRKKDDWTSTEKMLDEVLVKYDVELQSMIKERIKGLYKKYSHINDGLELSLPEATTESQINAIQNAFAIKGETIRDLFSDLIKLEISLCIANQKNI